MGSTDDGPGHRTGWDAKPPTEDKAASHAFYYAFLLPLTSKELFGVDFDNQCTWRAGAEHINSL